MFVCNKCVDGIGAFAIPTSYGKCEECGRTGSCADIHHSKWYEWKDEHAYNQPIIEPIKHTKADLEFMEYLNSLPTPQEIAGRFNIPAELLTPPEPQGETK